MAEMTDKDQQVDAIDGSARRQLGIVSGGYFLGVFGANVAVFPLISFLMYFLTDTIGISVAVATVVLTVPKIWDMIVDPAIGIFSDRYARKRGSRWGVFVFLSISLPAFACGVFLLPPLAAPVFTAIVIIKSSLYTVFLVSHVATADDIGESGIARRDSMLSLRIVGQASGGLAAGAAAPVLLELGSGGTQGFALVALSFGLVGIVGLLLCSIALRKVPVSEYDSSKEHRGGASLASTLQVVWRKPKALGLIIGNLMVTMAGTFISILLPYVNKYVIGASDAALSPMFTMLMATMLVGSAIAASLSRYLGTNSTFYIASGCLLGAGSSLFLTSTAALWLTVSLASWGFGMGLFIVSLQSSLIDEAKSVRSQVGAVGLFLGLLFAGGKLGDTLGGVITGGILSVAGGTEALASAQGQEVLRLGLGITPPLLVTLGFAAFFLFARWEVMKGRLTQTVTTG